MLDIRRFWAIFDSFMIGTIPKSSHSDVVTTVEIKMAATSMGHYSTEKWNLNRSHWIINMDLYIISLLKDSIYVVLHILGSGNIV